MTAGSTTTVSFTNKLNTGGISLTKTTEDGQNLSGWQFGIYSNSACTTLVSGPHSTNTSGKISVTGLTPGTYYVKEIGHTDSAINALYYCSSTNPQAVTVTAGSTASVSFTNKLLTASAAVDGKKVTMLEDNGSVNAEAPLTVVNTHGFDLPKTGDNGTFVFTVVGILLMAGAVSVIALVSRKKRSV